MSIKTRDQLRAKLVFENIQSLLNDNYLSEKYGSLALNAPALIRNCGLMQTLAFFQAKNENQHLTFLRHLQNELQEIGSLSSTQELLAYTMDCNLNNYMHLSKEVLALCQWHKRFSQSILKAQTGGGN